MNTLLRFIFGIILALAVLMTILGAAYFLLQFSLSGVLAAILWTLVGSMWIRAFRGAEFYKRAFRNAVVATIVFFLCFGPINMVLGFLSPGRFTLPTLTAPQPEQEEQAAPNNQPANEQPVDENAAKKAACELLGWEWNVQEGADCNPPGISGNGGGESNSNNDSGNDAGSDDNAGNSDAGDDACKDGEVLGNQFADLSRVPVGTLEGIVVVEVSWTGNGFGGYDRAILVVEELDASHMAFIRNAKTIRVTQYCGTADAVTAWATTHIDAMVQSAQDDSGNRPNPQEIGVYLVPLNGSITVVREGPLGPSLEVIQQRVVMTVE